MLLKLLCTLEPREELEKSMTAWISPSGNLNSWVWAALGTAGQRPWGTRTSEGLALNDTCKQLLWGWK